MQIDSHPHECVDKAESVRTGILAGFCNGHNIRNIRTELNKYRLLHNRFDGSCNLGSSVACCSEAHSAVVNIRAADIDFDNADLLTFVETCRDLRILMD